MNSNHQGQLRPATPMWAPKAMLLGSAIIMLSACAGSTEPAGGEEELVTQAPIDTAEPTSVTAAPSTGDVVEPDSDTATPTLSLQSSSATIEQGSSVTLSWSSSQLDDCAASGGWSGAKSGSGSETVGPLDAATTFSLSCSGPDGNVLEMITVSVISTVNLSWTAPTQNVDGSELLDLTQFRIYYGANSGSYTDVLDVADAGATAQPLSVSSGEYYFAMTALDAEGNESDFSNEVLKTAP